MSIKKKKIPQVPDASFIIDTDEIFTKIYGPEDKPFTKEETLAAIPTLTASELTAAQAYLGWLIYEYQKTADAVKAALDKSDVSNFPNADNALVAFTDTQGKPLGSVWARTEVDVKRSTDSPKVAEEVKKAIKNAGLANAGDQTYIKIEERLQNNVLFEANKNGVLPATVSKLLTEKEVEVRNVTYVAAPEPLKKGE